MPFEFKIENKLRVLLIFICFFVLIQCLFPLKVFAAETTIETINVGYFAFPGYHEITNDGSVNRGSGYGNDFLQLLRRYSNLNYEYVGYEKSQSDMTVMLKNGKIDMFTLALKSEDTSDEFAFSNPVGRFYTEITVRTDDNRFQSGEYDKFDGIVLGTVKGYGFEDNLAVFAEEKSFTYTLNEYSSEEAMVEALMSEEVDGFVYGNLRRRPGERMVVRFAPEDYYAVVRKEDKALLDEINYGIEQMDINEGDWRNELFYKYYGDSAVSDGELFFTQREKDYIAAVQSGEKVITACAQPDRDPYSYVEDGKMVGVIPEYFDYLMDMAGLPYTTLIAENREQHQEWTLTNYVDVYMDARNTGATILEDWIGISADPYMKLTTSRVTKRDFTGTIKRVAVTGSQGLKGIDDDLVADGADVVVCDAREAAMQAVNDGKADACYVYTYMAEKFINNGPDGNLVSHIMNEPVYDMQFYIRPTTDHELISILFKCQKADKSHILDELVDKYTQFNRDTVSLTQFVKNNPWVLVALISIVVGVGAIILLIARNNKVLRSVAKERQVYADSLQDKNDQLEESVKQAQSANLAKTSFLSNMSHDIRTPMNAIIGFTNIAKKQNQQDDVGKCLDKIEESSEHLLTLINDVLNISRIESGKIIYEPSPANITKVTDAVIAIVQGFMAGRNLNFSIERKPHETPYVITDPVRVREVLVNILGNAVKFTEDGGSITFRSDYHKTEEDNKIVIRYTVSDTGIGMSKEYLERIFDEFSQENTGARTQYKGTGLGMPITKRYVEMMNGTISVESEKGVGTTVVVELPMELTSADKIKNKSSYDKTDLDGVKVLVAEDNDLNAEIAVFQLEEYGMKVTRTVDGQEAVDAFSGNPVGTFDVILMDIMMPRLNGYEATKQIRSMENRPDSVTIPIIAMTANAFAEDIQASLDAGMNAHIAKPLVMEEVIKVISANLN